MSRYEYEYLKGESLLTWAIRWFSMSNDAFYSVYGFNFNPHDYPGLYEAAQIIVYPVRSRDNVVNVGGYLL